MATRGEDRRRAAPRAGRAGSPRRRRPRRAIGIAGRVMTSGSSRWSRSVARSSVRAAKKAPKIASGTGSVKRSGERAQRRAAEEDDDERPPVDRADPAGRPDDRARLVESRLVGRPAGADPVGGEPPRGPGDRRGRRRGRAAPRPSAPRRAPAPRASRSTRPSRRGRPTAWPSGSRPCRRCRGGPTAPSRTGAGRARCGSGRPRPTSPTFAMSAYQLSISCQYSSTRGSCQSRSPARTAAAATSSYQACGRAEPAGHQVAEGAGDRARERGHVHDVGRPEALRVGHRVAEDEAPLGVGVDDVHGLAVEGGHDVAGTGGVRAGHVLDRRGDGQERACRGRGGRRSRRRRARCRPPSCPSSSPPSGRPA